MADDFSTIPLDEAVKSLGLDKHFHNRATLDEYVTADDRIAQVEADPEWKQRIASKDPDWRETMRQRHPSRYFVRHYDNHAVAGGDLDMDGLPGRDVAGIVVDGDLELHGSIFNWEIDTTAAFLWVRGSMHCTSIVFGSMDMVIDGNVTAGNLIVVTYNHGRLLIRGNVHAKTVIIDDDGASVIAGKVFAKKGWNSSLNAEVDLRESEWIKEVRPEFREEFFRADGMRKCGNGNVDLVKALLAGRDILRER